MKIEGTFLGSRVARRIFGLFCLAALAPTVVLSLVAYRNAADAAHAAAVSDVTAASKRIALTVYERLDIAHWFLADLAAESPATTGNAIRSGRFFRDAWRVGATGSATDSAPPGRLAPAIRAAIDLPDPPRVLVAGGEPPAVVLLAPIEDALAPGRWLVGEVEPRFLWGEADEYPAQERTCAFAGAQQLFCSAPAAPQAAGGAISGRWELFLGARFGSDPWRFETVGPARGASEVLPSLSYTLFAVWGGVLLLALLLSLIQIRRSMGPLDDLVERTRRIGEGNYAAPVSAARDEFRQLGTAFDDMAARVSRHVQTLKALSDVDQRILGRAEVADIVDLVVARLQALAPGCTACVMYTRTPGAPTAECHVGGAGSVVVKRETVPAPEFARAGDPEWTAIPGTAGDEPVASLRAGGAAVALVRTIEQDDGLRVWVALGCGGSPPPAAELAGDLAELGGRVAVAIAARRHEDRLVHQARHDPLTGLPNRLATQEYLAAALADPRRDERGFAAMFLDLDRFKAINDGLGHLSGDRLLVRVADVLRTGAGPGAFVARFGGDEFFVVFPGAGGTAAAVERANRIGDAFAAPIVVDGMEFVISASVGIALCPADADNAESLLRCADIAMYRAKARGGAGFAFFEDRMNREALQRIQLENDLRQALRSGAIDVHFQPRVDYRTGTILGAEALARWTHPTLGAVPTLKFVSLAEECGLIDELGAIVLDRACRHFARWRAAGTGLRFVSVNLSGRQLRSVRLVDLVRDALVANGIGRGELEVEITESVLLNEVEGASAQLEALRALGVGVALDDFGTGYSSLAYLRTLPVDTLKIDRQFIVDIEGSADAAALVRAIIALGIATGKHMVAEGVEQHGQAELLGAWGCHQIQGFVCYAPMPAEELTQILESPALRSGAGAA